LDEAGNIYVGGRWLDGKLVIDPGLEFANAGNNDLFVAKFDSQGRALWAIAGGGTGRDTILALAVDSFGDVFITGTLANRVVLGGGVPLASVGDTDFFISKISSYDLCLRDSSGRYRVRVNSTTGDYQVLTCSTAFLLNGTGVIRRFGCETIISDEPLSDTVTISVDSCRSLGRVSIRSLKNSGTSVIEISGSLGDNCECPTR
jgi:hypothetical protein